MMEGALHDCTPSVGQFISSDPFYKEERVRTIMVDDKTERLTLICTPGVNIFEDEKAVVLHPSGEKTHVPLKQEQEAKSKSLIADVDLDKGSLMPTRVSLNLEARNGRVEYNFYIIRVAHS